MDIELVNSTLQAIANFVNKAKELTNYYADKSLVDVTKLTRVEPLTIISTDLVNLDYMPDITNSLLSIFTGYYLQAISILTKVNDVEVIKLLDKLNPDRDESGFLMAETVSRESIANLMIDNYKYKLPSAISFEADSNDSKTAISDNTIKLTTEMSNLSVGKLVNVTINYQKDCDEFNCKDKDRNVTIPISVRLMVSAVTPMIMNKLLMDKSEDMTLSERYHSWRSGRINLIKDLIFCQDLIDEQKKLAVQDTTGTSQEIVRRVANAKKYGLLTKNPSLVSASNIYIISETNAKEIEAKYGGKLSSPRIRDRLFEKTYAMIIAVVDRDWERVTFYSRGISAGTDLSIKEIKSANKGKGVDIMDILKTFNNGMPPSF